MLTCRATSAGRDWRFARARQRPRRPIPSYPPGNNAPSAFAASSHRQTPHSVRLIVFVWFYYFASVALAMMRLIASSRRCPSCCMKCWSCWLWWRCPVAAESTPASNSAPMKTTFRPIFQARVMAQLIFTSPVGTTKIMRSRLFACNWWHGERWKMPRGGRIAGALFMKIWEYTNTIKKTPSLSRKH